MGLFFVGEGLQDAVELGTARSKSRYHVLGRRLQKGDDVGDELVLALDGSEGVELICTEVNGLFNIGSLEGGEGVAFLHEVLEELGGSVADVGAHQRGRLLESGIELGEVTVELFEGFVEEGVLDHEELDTGVEAGTAQLAGLLSVQSGSLNKVKAAVFLEGIDNILDNQSFIFLFHVFFGLMGYASTDLASTLRPGLMVLER